MRITNCHVHLLMILKAVNRTTTIPKSNLCYPWPQAPQGVPSSTLLESAIFFHLTFYCGTCKAINACHHISCFFKDFRVTFYLQDMKIQSVFFCAQIFRRIARSITPIFFVENWLICRSHLKQFIQCKSENYSIFWLFITSSELLCYVRQFSKNTQKSSISLKIRKKNSKLFFVKRLAVVSVFLRSGTILKKWPFSLHLKRHISLFNTACVFSRKWRCKMSIWGHFLPVYFLYDLLCLVIWGK